LRRLTERTLSIAQKTGASNLYAPFSKNLLCAELLALDDGGEGEIELRDARNCTVASLTNHVWLPAKSGNKATRATENTGPRPVESASIMQLLQTLSIFAFGLLVSALQSPPEELKIKTTYTPSDCTVKAQKGDPIKVHYVRLFSPVR
jgi:hypothetical protein